MERLFVGFKCFHLTVLDISQGSKKILVRCVCGTERYVQAYRIKHRQMKSCGCKSSAGRKKTPIDQYTLDDVFVKRYDSMADAARAMGCTDSVLRTAKDIPTKTSQGFKWKSPSANSAKFGSNPKLSGYGYGNGEVV